VAHPVVALVDGPTGWVQDVNFVLGAAVIASAIGLQYGVRPNRWARWAQPCWCSAVWGPCWPESRPRVPAHFLITFLSAGIGLRAGNRPLVTYSSSARPMEDRRPAVACHREAKGAVDRLYPGDFQV
jgi:hypothetical protein